MRVGGGAQVSSAQCSAVSLTRGGSLLRWPAAKPDLLAASKHARNAIRNTVSGSALTVAADTENRSPITGHRSPSRACLFVWNTFVNDARVYKEAAALAAAGWGTTVVCLQDPDDPALPMRERVAGFDVRRVTRFPASYRLCKWMQRQAVSGWRGDAQARRRLMLALPALVVLSPVALVLFAARLTGLLTLQIRFWIFVRMVAVGWRLNADVYHSNDLNTLPQGWLCAKVLRRRRLLYDSHEVQSSRTGYGRLHAWFERALITRADLMLMTTQMRAEYVAKRYGITPPTVIRNLPRLLDPDPARGDLRRSLNLPPDEPILLYQGGIQMGRGLEQLIDAVPRITRGTIVLMGDGRLKPKIVRLVRERGLAQRVRFAPKVPYLELYHYTAHAYLGFQIIQNVCFNHYSTISNKLLEYIMAGVPAIASDFPEVRRIVETYGSGLLVDPSRPEAIAEAANRLLQEPELHARCRKGCQQARLALNWEQEAGQFVALYEALVARREVRRRRSGT